MKRLRILPFALLGLVALWAGVWSGRSLAAYVGRLAADWQPGAPRVSKGEPDAAVGAAQTSGRSREFPLPSSIQEPAADPTQRPPLPGSRQPGSAAPAHQENLLIVGVDNLGDLKPALKSVWLAIYMPDRPHFMLLPIYPSQSNPMDQIGPDPTLPMLFSLTAEGAPGSEFIKALKEKELWWTHYLVLDETALSILIVRSDRRPEQENSPAGYSLQSVPNPLVEPLEALLAQARVAQNLCLDSASLVSGDPEQISGLYKQVRKHVSTDMDLEAALNEWSARLQIGAITCEFPSLATAMLLP